MFTRHAIFALTHFRAYMETAYTVRATLPTAILCTSAIRRCAFALADPEPELRPELIREVSPDAIIATGRSDYPNQINNALCFPYLFRAALDRRASTINRQMKLACVQALAEIARRDARFGKSYIVPDLLDPRLLQQVTPKVAQAAFQSGVALPELSQTDYEEQLAELATRLG